MEQDAGVMLPEQILTILRLSVVGGNYPIEPSVRGL